MGGAVRDMLLGARPKDFDILTTATPIQVGYLPYSHCEGTMIYSSPLLNVTSLETNVDVVTTNSVGPMSGRGLSPWW